MKTSKWLQVGTRTIDIMGESWRLSIEAPPHDVVPVPQLGECHYQEKYIHVWLTGEKQRDLDTLFHELQHVIRMMLGLESSEDNEDKEKDLEEHKQINPIALGLAYVFAHNEGKL